MGERGGHHQPGPEGWQGVGGTVSDNLPGKSLENISAPESNHTSITTLYYWPKKGKTMQQGRYLAWIKGLVIF